MQKIVSHINPDPSRIEILDAKAALPKLNAFKSTWGHVPKANGDITNEPQRHTRKDWMKQFKWDAVRFANKTYAVYDACVRSKDWCVWMDADTYVHSPWTYEDFAAQLPDNAWITYVGRGKGSQTWPECGFYGLNLNHPVCHEFLKEFERVYEEADNGIFLLEEWHDSFVFGSILNNMKLQFPNAHDYSADMYLREAKSGGGGHPLINGVLRQMDRPYERRTQGQQASLERKILWLTEQKSIGMKFSLWTDYGALNSKPVFDAFANSLSRLWAYCCL